MVFPAKVITCLYLGLGKMNERLYFARPLFRLQRGLVREFSHVHAQRQAAHCPSPLHVDYWMSGMSLQLGGCSIGRKCLCLERGDKLRVLLAVDHIMHGMLKIWQSSVDYSQVTQPEVQQESSIDLMMQGLFGSAYSPTPIAVPRTFQFSGASSPATCKLVTSLLTCTTSVLLSTIYM